MAMLKKHKKTLLSALQRVFCFILAATILGAVGVPSAVLALDGANPTVEIVGFMRGDSKDLRSSELLMAKVSNYDGNPQELTYEWKNKLGTYLYVFDKTIWLWCVAQKVKLKFTIWIKACSHLII